MNVKSVILILVVVSMLLSTIFARASVIEDVLKARFINDTSRSYSMVCVDLPQTTKGGYISFLRSATIHKGQIEVITSVFKQKGCNELGRVEYMIGSIEISDEEANAFISNKYLVVDQALGIEDMESMNSRLPGPTENIAVPPHLEDTFKNFKKPNRIFYDLEIMTSKDEILNLQTNAESSVLHIKSNFGISVLTKN